MQLLFIEAVFLTDFRYWFTYYNIEQTSISESYKLTEISYYF